MKENKISIVINRPLAEVFNFTINPENTPKWIEHIEKEETNEYPPKVGTIYRNRAVGQDWDEYFVSDFIENESFELTSKDGTYHVLYTYRPILEDKTEMEYYEWVDEGVLSNPFQQRLLEKLKSVLEG